MQEFTSISVSSYEAGSLADRLTEQAGEGWSVVAVVPTGSSITAYLGRETSAAAPASGESTEAPAAAADDQPTEEASAAHETAEAGPAEEAPDAHEPGEVAPAAAASEVAAPGLPTTEPVTAEDTGWSVTPEPATTPSAETPADDIAALAAQLGDEGAAAETVTAATEPVATQAAAETAAPAAATPASPAAAASAAPAGWYADPSSRFELRYWDGSQWTEHVSRAGQQYTDPPVA